MLNKIGSVRFEKPWNSNKWDFKQVSYWYSNNYFINENDSANLQKALKKIATSSNITINKGDVIYASKSSDIPRFKLKEFIKENGLKKTSRHSYANVIIINRGVFNELLSKKLQFGNHYFINENILMKNLDKWFNSVNYSDLKGYIKNSKDKNNVVIADVSNKNMMKELKKDPAAWNIFMINTHQTKGTLIQIYRENKILDLLELFINNINDILTDKIKFVFDEDLFVELNKEGIELDDDYLQTLRDMLFSKDKSNVKLGFEMMSNLTLNDQSILSISFLLNELIHTTSFRPSYYVSTNTNLKSLLTLLRTKGIHWERDWKTFGTGLRMNFKEGKEGEIVKKFLLDNINREFKLSNSAAESLVDIVFTTEAK